MKKNYLSNPLTSIAAIILLCLVSNTNAQELTTISVSGFNEDIVANGVGTMNSSITNIVDSDRFCYLSTDWKLNSGDPNIPVGLPADGIIISPGISGLTYQIGATGTNPYAVNNSLRLDNIGGDDTGTIVFDTPAAYTNLYFLAASGNGETNFNMTINFDDASSQSVTNNTVPDWFLDGLPIEISGVGRGDTSNDNVETPVDNPKLFRLETPIDAGNTEKLITSIDITKISQGDDSVLNIVAVSGLTTKTLGVEEVLRSEVSVVPNPVTDFLQVSATQNIEILALYNVLGQEVMVLHPAESTVRIDMSALQTGSYFLKTHSNGTVSTLKVIKL